MKTYDRNFINELIDAAEKSPRRRAHHTIHEADDDPVQRLFVALAPGTYFRPHRHTNKKELVIILQGRLAILVFDNDGKVIDRYELTPGTMPVLEHPMDNWHACVALAPETLFIEVKQGPFTPIEPEDFAQWAPAEGTPGAPAFEQWYHSAQPGDKAPVLNR
ncbi:MAG: WbuC family cupin fold metalloprotein [Victivallaceae bacterium]|nr:WbuC family cupin fold metalloprotein [Victivallaceae bacterium]